LPGASSLRTVLGKKIDEYFYMVFNGLRAVWGEEELDRVMTEITGLLDLEVSKKHKDG